MNLDYDPVPLLQSAKFCTCAEHNCRCGEKNVHEWAWDDNFVSTTSELCERNLEVRFHPQFSIGTAVVRGNTPMTKGRHHFWEIKMVTPVYGTDVMVGVGTDKVDLTGIGETFCSLLGRDRESWGFSYKGYIQHGGETRVYSGCFGQGSLVGVHLDTWKGTLQFFLNRKPLGIAFTGLRNTVLYPMVSSTAAKSKIRITYCCSMPVSLQMDCLSMLRPSQRAYLSAAFPGLRYLSESIFADILQKQFDDESDVEDFDFTILDDFDFALVGLGRKKRKCVKR
ncbi:hypothetical protein KPH14_009491 [Odynerus spinipes]|uniref:B30.2/SPRY domain-containing protein n=1 Tax=Odynerus spinipes TaxID=1348599 RepID=A0AAD9RQK9_9HYME|nr:hypothetical protein KPH14_009491 [Odynerus spinipes]